MNKPARPSPPAPAAVPASWRDPTRPNLRRSLAFAAVGALVGLGLAGYALFTAKGTSTLVVPPEDVALVNQQPIARSDYLLQLQAAYGVTYAQATPVQRRKVLDDLIREELFVQRAKELDVASADPDVRAAMVAAVEQGIAADVMASRPSEEVLRAYYTAHRADYASEGMMTVRDLVFADATQASAAALALRGGATPEAVKGRFQGHDSGKVDGEEFYFAARIHLGPALFQAARDLTDGHATPPLAAPDGVHLLWMAHNRPPVARSFEEARTQVFGNYQNAATARVQHGDEGFFRKRANVLIAQDLR